MDRLADKLEHDIMQDMLKKEEDFKKDNTWIKDWLEGKLRESEIFHHLEKKGIPYRNIDAQIFLVDIYPCESNLHLGEYRLYKDFLLHTNAIVRRIFEDVGISLLGYMEEDIFVYILIAPKNKEDVWDQVEDTAEILREGQNRYIDYSKAHFALGKVINKSEDLHISYETACKTMDILKRQHGKTAMFDRLYIHRILYELKKGTPCMISFTII